MESRAGGVALLPDNELTGQLRGAVSVAGCEVVSDVRRARALIWCSPDPSGVEAVLLAAPDLEWIQLPFAGVERFVSFFSKDRVWTAAKGIYGPAVAELTLALILAGLRRVGSFARARSWLPLGQTSLWSAKVTILGGGGIARSLIDLLAPFNCDVVVVRRSGAGIEGAPRAARAHGRGAGWCRRRSTCPSLDQGDRAVGRREVPGAHGPDGLVGQCGSRTNR